MNVPDSSAWLEYFVEGSLTLIFVPIIEDRPNLIVPSITIYEVHKRMFLQRGALDAMKAVSIMTRGRVVLLDTRLALEASRISITHKLAMADAIIYATTLANNAELWTSDSHFKGLPNVRYFEKA